MFEGESREVGDLVKGYSVEPQCIGNHAKAKPAPSYLEPNSNSLQKPKRGRSVLAFSAGISMLKNRRYRERQLPIKTPLNKGAITKKSTISFRPRKFSLASITFRYKLLPAVQAFSQPLCAICFIVSMKKFVS
jgi:hypothetical protein